MFYLGNAAIYPLSFIIGVIIGSFLNVVIERFHGGGSLLRPPSHCPKCRHRLGFIDLFPIISFIFLRGRCRYCREKISWQYPLVELLSGLLFLLAAFISLKNYSDPAIWYDSGRSCFFSWLPDCGNFLIGLLRDWLAVAFLIIIFVYDLKWRLILDRIAIPAIIIVFILNLALGYSLINLLLAMAIGFGFFALQYVFSRGRWIGGGDLRVGALMGALLGWPQVILAIFMAYIIGAAVSIILIMAKGKKLTSEIPFAVFLVPATLISLWFGQYIIGWYLGFLIS